MLFIHNKDSVFCTYSLLSHTNTHTHTHTHTHGHTNNHKCIYNDVFSVVVAVESVTVSFHSLVAFLKTLSLSSWRASNTVTFPVGTSCAARIHQCRPRVPAARTTTGQGEDERNDTEKVLTGGGCLLYTSPSPRDGV